MSIEPVVLHVPAGVGINQALREEHVPLGTSNLYTENARLTETGGLVKRPGFEQITSNRLGSSTRTSGHRLLTLRDSIVVSDGDILETYSPSVGEWIQRGRLPGCDARRYQVASMSEWPANANLPNLVDVAYGNGYYVALTLEQMTNNSYIVVAHVIDATTKQVVYAADLSDLASTVSDVKVAIAGTDCVVFYNQGANIRARRLSLSAIASGFATAVVVANNFNETTFDVLGLTTRVAIAYENTVGGTTRITIKTVNSALDALTTLETQNETTTSDTIVSLAIAGAETEELWLTWAHTSGAGAVRVSARNPTSLSTSIIASSTAFTPTTVNAFMLAIGRTAAHEAYLAVAFQDDDVNGAVESWFVTASVRITNNAGSLVVDRPIDYVGGWAPVSKPFAVSGRAYIELAYDDTTSGIYDVMLVDITGDASQTSFNHNETVRPVGWVAPRSNVYKFANLDGHGCARHVAMKSATVAASVHVVRASGTTASICVSEYDFAAQRHLGIQYAGSLYLTGGTLYQFDGQRAYNAGFPHGPRLLLEETGTGLTGTYLYTAVYEYTDAQGNVTLSPPAPVETIVVANKTVTITVRLPSVSWKEGFDSSLDLEPRGLRRVKTKIYRTENGGGTFYFLTTIVGRPSDGVEFFNDNVADATLISGAKLYKAPGTLGTAKDRQTIGAVRHFCECNGVLVCIDDSGTTLRAFAGRVPGETPWHHDTLQIPIESEEEVIALASIDGSAVVFTRRAIFVVPVEPSNAAISAGGFGVPRRLAVNAGCLDPRSVVVTGLGVFFQSDRGIEILTRSLSVEYIGEKIQTTFADYPNVVAAVLDVRNSLVRFSLAQTGSTTVGVDAVFDLTVQQWSTFDVKTGAGASAQSVSATYGIHSGEWRYLWLESDGTVHFESNTSWLDKGSSWVPLKWIPAWVKTELQREHQFWQSVLLHDRKTACGLLVEFATDWANFSAADNKVWTEAEFASYTRQVELRWTKRGQAFKARFSDSAPAVLGTGQGVEFVGLSIDLAPHQGATQGTPRVAEAARR